MPKIATVEIATAEARGGFGSVTLGDVSAPADWKILKGHVEIRFNTKAMSAELMRDLEHYRSTSRQVAVQLPGEGQKFNCIAIGFERVGNAATFYLTKSKPAVSTGLRVHMPKSQQLAKRRARDSG